MTEYESLEVEKNKIYNKIKALREVINNTTDEKEIEEHKQRLRIMDGIYQDYLEELERSRPSNKKKRMAPKTRTVALSESAMDAIGFEVSDISGNSTTKESFGTESSSNKERLLRALRRGGAVCSPRQQQVFMLYADGKKPKEISEMLDIELSSVYRSLQKIKRTMNHVDEFQKQFEKYDCTKLDMRDTDMAASILGCLTEVQAVYMYLYYGELFSLRDIADLLGVNHTSVCRGIQRGEARIRALFPDNTDVHVCNFDALEPILYNIYLQNDVTELVPQKAKDAVKVAKQKKICKRLNSEEIDKLASVKIYPSFDDLCERPSGYKLKHNSRLVNALKEKQQNAGDRFIIQCLCGIMKIFTSAKQCVSRVKRITLGKLSRFEQGIV